MSARSEVHAALLRAGYGAPGADRLLDQVEHDALVRGKDTDGGSQPLEGASTPAHRLWCEYPEALPCRCPVRPRALPEASLQRAQRRERIGAFITGTRLGQADAWVRAGDAR
ncbi:hypothetical protein [Streptomyces alboflavus]|uniref:hypothetical protein n=1 Tax=Streptomyces alboflavus TaxID=67267 RepID=UPI000F658715|nr:hypothetical protein [Streptomyces alboflavus]